MAAVDLFEQGEWLQSKIRPTPTWSFHNRQPDQKDSMSVRFSRVRGQESRSLFFSFGSDPSVRRQCLLVGALLDYGGESFATMAQFDALLDEMVYVVESTIAKMLAASELDELLQHGAVLGQVGGSPRE
ncbi:hypothetical protein DFQ14_101302 [Halopolyspora algeriensis]|uniref:Uncharacterized protein n=1 Tax=Halopolyspora algeriensis TaxID=1500506 RepID=A0A368W014_9ACTN|nr:hypothetical protein DFQ14_101302 [Halopolyspora algeriensis]TQM48053.1 hypothetical protein FHU43_3006 [Halopolyspora algeriensis]